MSATGNAEDATAALKKRRYESHHLRDVVLRFVERLQLAWLAPR